ncbi:RING finger [Cordyceps militaris]|uniref:RING-type E3 ubiquitin transferase n=1 Tax=Cordyceps militaris TaxID=73501 RepID=A0A2H4STV7_CORMI|nr:RING finger [Cordyceps militaris]
MPKMRLGWYAGASTALAGAVIFSAFQQRANFYSAMVYLSQSNFCLLVLINFTLLIYGTFVYGISQLCWGTLRTAEVEQLTERAWFAITETCLAMTIFRDELGAWFLVMFTALVTGKVWGWIGDGRVEFLEQQPPANPRLFHARLTVSLLMSFVYDVWILRYCINTVIQEARADMMVMFLFEFAVLATTSGRSGVRYILSIIEQKMIQTQTQARLLERKQEVREQRDAIVRQREEAAASGQPAETETPLPNPDDIDEMDIEVPGWATKGEWVLWLDLFTDTVKLVLYVTFFVLLTIFYTFPIHIMRDLLMTARDFLKRLNSVLRYRRAIQEMNRYPDATQAELDQENTCIICREDMRVWDLIANPGALDRIRPKKLPCGHILHLGCLKSWLERQQVCPTCRSPVSPDRVQPTTNRNANRAPAAPQIPNNGLQGPQVGFAQEPRFGRFALGQGLLDPPARAGLNADGPRRPANAEPQALQRPNVPNIRPMEEFHDMMRNEERRRQEAEEQVRRRWRRAMPQDTVDSQPQDNPSQSQSNQPPSQQGTGATPTLGQPSQTFQPSTVQQGHHQTDLHYERMLSASHINSTRQTLLNQTSALRSHRLRTLSNMYGQASVLVRQEAEALRISNEQLQVLGQLVAEFDRLEASHHENADSPLPGSEAQAQDQILSQNLMGLRSSRSVLSRTQSPVMMRHGATSYSASIPAGSPELPEGVAIPPGWTLMPLQRLDNQPQARPASTQRSSRASSAGPATSTLGEERSVQAQVPQAPTSQPSHRTNAHVLERIPGTNNFRLAGSTGGGPRSESATATSDALADAQAGGVVTQQQLLDRVFGRGLGRESGSGARAENSTRSTTVTSSITVPVEEQPPAAAVASTPAATPTSDIPNWGGSSQPFGSLARSQLTGNGTVVSARDTASSAASSNESPNDGDQCGSAASDSKDEDEDEDKDEDKDDAEHAEGGNSAGKAVTMVEVSDEEDD